MNMFIEEEDETSVCAIIHKLSQTLNSFFAFSASAWGFDILSRATPYVTVQNTSDSLSFHVFLPSSSLRITQSFGNADEEGTGPVLLTRRGSARGIPLAVHANKKQAKRKKRHVCCVTHHTLY